MTCSLKSYDGESIIQIYNKKLLVVLVQLSRARMFTAASMTYQRQRKREKEAAKRALAKMEVGL